MWPAVRRNAAVRSDDLQTLLDVLTGVAGAGDRVQLTRYNNSSNYALDVRNLDTTNSYGLRVRDAVDANLLLVYKDNITVGANVTVGASLTVDGLDLSAHAHTGAAGHGVQVAHTSLTDIGTNTHAQVDTHIAATSAHGASSNPGAAAAMLTTDASGVLQVVKLGAGIAPVCGIDSETALGITFGKFGSSFPVYLLAGGPNIGFNVYHNAGWKFGKGSSASYGGVIGLGQTDGIMQFYSTNSGDADAAATLTSRMSIYPSGGIHIGSTPADAGVNSLKVQGNLRVGNTNYWTLAGWTTNADAAVNGYVTVTIDGTTRKLATIA